MEGGPVRGHVDLLVLAVLDRGAAHGYAVAEHVRERSGGALDLAEGTIYPALYRLERNGLVESAWHTVKARRRRVYRLTAAGSAQLEQRRRTWRELVEAVGAVLE